jgi:hypothetical protein
MLYEFPLVQTKDFFHDAPNLFESASSYVFGNGNPSGRLHQRQLQMVASYIRSRGGAVVAEQLMPFVLEYIPRETTSENDSPYALERLVSPLVRKFSGQPLVAENGDIVYVFPELMTTATACADSVVPSSSPLTSLPFEQAIVSPEVGICSEATILQPNCGLPLPGPVRDSNFLRTSSATDAGHSDQALLQEQEIQFSAFPNDVDFLRLAGHLSLVLPLYLICCFPSVIWLQYYFVYVVLVNLVPAIRLHHTHWENKRLKQQNEKRKKWHDAIADPASSLQRKLQEAKKYQTQMKHVDAANAVDFDTNGPADDGMH